MSPFMFSSVGRMCQLLHMGLTKSCDTSPGTKHFSGDQRLRLETPSWRVLDYQEKLMAEVGVERQREWILGAQQVAKNREYPFAEHHIVDSSCAVDVNLTVFAKMSALVEALRLCGRYELLHQLWDQFFCVPVS